MIVSGILLNGIIVKQTINHNTVMSKIDSLQADTQSKFNELTTSLLQTKEDLQTLDSELGSLDEELVSLKASTSADFSGIIDDAIKGVVTIKTDISQGTGFIIDNNGYVVTNYHVMEGATAAAIYTYEGDTHNVALIGYDDNFDIALLKIEGIFERLKLANSDDVQIGKKVIAIGNPLGLQFSVSEGIVSAVHRTGLNDIQAYIQTDAALNPGNSGGPLIDKNGKVIGINNFKIGNGENLGFALESNYIKDVVNDISQQALQKDLV